MGESSGNMNRVLMAALIKQLLFLGLSEDYEVNRTDAEEQIEDLGTILQDLNLDERSVFISYTYEMVDTFQANTTESVVAFLRSLPEKLGLIESDNQLYFIMDWSGFSHLTNRRQPLEIQLLDGMLRARAVGYMGRNEEDLVIKGHRIPQAVIQAAQRLEVGENNYVNKQGEVIDPMSKTREFLHHQPKLP